MKYVFLSLLLLNILYALWQLQGRPDDGQEPVAISSPAAEVTPVESPVVQGEPQPRSAAALCVRLGQFETMGEAEQLRQRLLALDIASQVQPREVVSGTDYWLVMPVVGGERHAVIQLSALQEQGIDSFLITRGELAGQLSLGVFSREEYAQLRQEQLRELGHEVHLHAMSKKDQQFVVEVSSAARRLVDQAMLSRLRADFPSLQHQYQPCTGVANSPRIP
ncbi:hypothetical protein [Pseudomonas sp. MYb185]|uniref:hypothetical protein n=1 Tax=Pseudomonas sp. MYb185 TaxID=1848729 RepID=UPI000CFD1396|nr:hypothetical protein [Pseudomonas sp. MYb185]PRB79462.1 hypothetical protein CQ007_15695 [Pseudomonas sp. MYb185]